MRRSTLIGMFMVAVLLVGMTWLLNYYVDKVRTELDNGRELTKEFVGDIAPETRVKLLRLKEDPKGAVGAARQPGLDVQATPSEASWKADATGNALAERLARAASKRYGPDRPIAWLIVTLTSRPGGGDLVFGFRVADDRDVVQTSRTETPPPR